MESYSRFMDSSHDAAKVDGRTISVQELDNAVRDQSERMREALGASYDARMFEGPEARKQVLDQLVLQRVVSDEVARENLTASNARLVETISSIPAIAQLPKKADGSIDDKAYLQLLAAQGMTPDQFDARMRFELATQQLSGAVSGTAFMPKSLLERLLAIRDQQRDVQALLLKPSDYTAKVKVDDAALKTYFEAHQATTRFPSMPRCSTGAVRRCLAAAQQVSPDELNSYYQSNLARFRTDEQRRASHILIAAAKDAPAAQRRAAKEKAEKLLAELRKHPDTFADVARKESQDPGSAAKGGDLASSAAAPWSPFEDAMYALAKDGDISDVVETDYGYHIVKLTGIAGRDQAAGCRQAGAGSGTAQAAGREEVRRDGRCVRQHGL